MIGLILAPSLALTIRDSLAKKLHTNSPSGIIYSGDNTGVCFLSVLSLTIPPLTYCN